MNTDEITKLRKKVGYTNGRRQVMAMAELAEKLAINDRDEARTLASSAVRRSRELLAKQANGGAQTNSYQKALAYALAAFGMCAKIGAGKNQRFALLLEAAELLEKLGDWKKLLHVLEGLALAYRIDNDLPSTLDIVERALVVAQERKIRAYLAGLYAARAAVHIRMGARAQAEADAEMAQQTLRFCRTDERRLQAYSSLAEWYYNQREFEAAIRWYTDCIPIARRLDEMRGLASIYWQIAHAQLEIGSVENQRTALMEGRVCAMKAKWAWMEAGINVELGTIAKYYGAFEEALNCMRNAETLYEKIADNVGLVLSYTEIGLLYLEFDFEEQGYRVLRRSLQLLLTLEPLPNLVISLLAMLNKPCWEREDWIRIRDYMANVKTMTALNSQLEVQTWVSIGLGQAYRNLGDYIKAERELLNGVELARATKTQFLEVNALYFIGAFYAKREEYRLALSPLEKALAIAEHKEYEKNQFAILDLLQQVYESLGEPQLALTALRKLHALEKSRYSRRNHDIVTQSIQRHEFKNLRNERDEALRSIERLTDANEELRRQERENALRFERLHNAVREWRDTLRSCVSSVAVPETTAIQNVLAAMENMLVNDAETPLIETLHGDDERFLRAMREHCSTFSQTELKVCLLIRSKLDSKEICRIMNVAPRTVDTYRYRIRKKLKLAETDNLNDILASV